MLGTSKANAFDGEVSKAFADFIQVLYSSTQSSNKGTDLCVYGNDDVSSRIDVKNVSLVFLDDNIGSRKNHYKECRLIYVARDKEKFVKSFIDVLNRSGALTLAVFDSFVNDGGMLFIDLGRRDFELTVNAKAFKASGIKLDSAFTGLIINNK